MTIDYSQRLNAIRAISGVDAVAIMPGTSMHYFTGLHYFLSERPIILFVLPDKLGLVVPKLELATIQKRADLNAELFPWDDEEWFMPAFQRAVDMLGLRGKTLGIDSLTMRAAEVLGLQAVDPTLTLKPVEEALLRIRAIKTPDEIALMRRAARASEAALGDLLKLVQPGMTEQEIAAKLDELQFKHGGEALAFGTLIQTGANSSNPHGETTDRALQRDEFLLIDFGCQVGGYHSDITRTFVVGSFSPEMQTIYNTVKLANEAAFAAVAPGVLASAVDKAARDVITEAGYGPYFTHRTGHGLGTDGQRFMPQISSSAHYPLEVGMTFTIEPGIYVPGLGGVRLEDNVMVTESGAESLTTFPKNPVL
ncbi:MAG: aminopeptidase P family protein [Anaerolineae bacterium]|nr:aminopeptidase P family protein [Anaerolineae bacterium]